MHIVEVTGACTQSQIELNVQRARKHEADCPFNALCLKFEVQERFADTIWVRINCLPSLLSFLF